MNLNRVKILTDNGETPLLDYSYVGEPTDFDKTEVYFRDIESKLVDKIGQFKDGAIFGCVAWLTSVPILEALSNCRNVQILIQKEDFLRPDSKMPKTLTAWKNKLRKLYGSLKCELLRYQCGQPMDKLSHLSDPTIESVRCVGGHNAKRAPAFPRAHNKFLVFCKLTPDGPDGIYYLPVAVWTGSFNMTDNATNSFENAVYLEASSGYNPIMNSFLKEHHQIFALSERLDWTSNWVAPEFRIGT